VPMRVKCPTRAAAPRSRTATSTAAKTIITKSPSVAMSSTITAAIVTTRNTVEMPSSALATRSSGGSSLSEAPFASCMG
jgi:hypothetical protein